MLHSVASLIFDYLPTSGDSWEVLAGGNGMSGFQKGMARPFCKHSFYRLQEIKNINTVVNMGPEQ